MEQSGELEFQAIINKMIQDIEDEQWPQFMRRLGYDYKDHNSDEDKIKMLYNWKVEMIKRISMESLITTIKLVRREVFEHDQDITTNDWQERMNNNRQLAQLFYGVIKHYTDTPYWNRSIVREKLKITQDVICRINEEKRYVEERKYKLLDNWRKKRNIESAQETEEELSKLGVTTKRQLSISSVARFQALLQNKAQNHTRIDLPIDLDKAIEAVTLQILKKPASLPEYIDSVGQYNKRKDMTMIYESPKGDTTIKELFTLAKANATEASKHFVSEIQKDEYVLTQGNNILVTGQAGIGKTTLTKMLAKLILKKEILPKTKYLIYIKIRNINFERSCNIVDFLREFAGFESLFEDIDTFKFADFKQLNSSEQVAFLFDGLDEAHTDKMNKTPPDWIPDKEACPSIILRKIMRGDIFPKAKKLWTSRQRQAYELHKEVRPHTIVQILGLDEQAQDDLGKQLCTEESWPKVKIYLQDHPDLQVICYVPVICIIAISSIHSSLIKQETDVELHTMTDVLAYALHLYALTDHIREYDEEISKVPKLAWDSFIKEKIIFTEQDFKDAGIDKKALEAFLILAVDKDTNFQLKLVVGQKKSSFSHLIWHEMFTAIYGLIYSERNDFENKLSNLLEPRWEVVAKLMFGLIHFPTLKRIKIILQNWYEENIQRNIQSLKNFGLVQMQNFHNFDTDKLKEKTVIFIQICSWVRETNTQGFLDEIRLYLPEVIDICGDVMPSDIRCITYVLPEGHSLRLGVDVNVRFISNSLLLLCTEIQRKKFKIINFNLEGNNINKIHPCEFSICINYVDELSLRKCRVSNDFLRETCHAIERRETPMKTLDLSHNPITIVGATYLCKCLHKVNSLNIDTCEFDELRFKLFAEALRNTNHFIKLHVGYTNINDQAAVHLCSCLRNIGSMAYARCGILDRGFLLFTKTIQELPKPMEEIILSTNISKNNDLSKMSDDEKALEVSRCLKNVKRLKLNCWIRRTGAESLARAVRELDDPMELLDVSGNKFGDEGAFAFLPCLNKINKLVMENCAVTTEGFTRFKDGYMQASERHCTVVFGNIEGLTATRLEPQQ